MYPIKLRFFFKMPQFMLVWILRQDVNLQVRSHYLYEIQFQHLFKMNYQIKSLTLKTKFENSLNKLLLTGQYNYSYNYNHNYCCWLLLWWWWWLLLLLNQKRKWDIISNLWITPKKHVWESAAHWNSYQQLHKYINENMWIK